MVESYAVARIIGKEDHALSTLEMNGEGKRLVASVHDRRLDGLLSVHYDPEHDGPLPVCRIVHSRQGHEQLGLALQVHGEDAFRMAADAVLIHVPMYRQRLVHYGLLGVGLAIALSHPAQVQFFQADGMHAVDICTNAASRQQTENEQGQNNPDHIGPSVHYLLDARAIRPPGRCH